MSEWIVYSKDGLKERCRLKSVEYNGSYMNERVVTATFKHFEEVAFEVFDYIEYRGERFEIEAIPTVKKTSSHDYEYDLRFVSLKYELERCEMRDIVPDDNRVVYPTPLSFSFTGTVRYLAERIQANLDALYGEGVWSITLEDGVDSEEKNITISQQNCWNALSLVNTTYNLNFQVKGRNVVIGNSNSSVGFTFKYGKGNGLYEIERTSDSDTGIVTKLRAYGSDRNLDYSYPKRPEWSDSVLDTSFILSPLRLMLPSFKADGKTDYILADEAVIAKYGIREASVIYDDIYPSITGAVVAGNAIDEIKGVEPIADDNASTFVIYLHNLGFDLESHLTTSDAQISMKSGAMQGYTFNMSNIEKQSDGSYKITLGRITTDTSDTGNYSIPNKDWNMKAGDKFVLLNILMPQEYIRNAEERLLERAEEYLAEYGKTNFGYSVGIHDKFLKEHSDIYDQLIEGSKLSVYDEEIGINEEVTIQSLTITENAESNILPQVKVTLNNKPSASTLERIQGQIKELSDSASGSFSSQSELLSQYRKKLDKPFFDRLFAAVDENGNEIPSTDLTTPIFYIKARYNFASLGGITTYLNDGSFDLPSIYAGIPVDETTITKREDGTLMLNPNLELGGLDEEALQKYLDDYNYAKKSDIPSLDGYAKLTDVDNRINDLVNGAPQAYDTLKEIADVLQGNVNSIGDIITTLGTKADKTYVDTELAKYIPIAGDTEVAGVKNFLSGLKVGGLPISKYEGHDDVIYIDANVVLRGGLTQYAVDPVTIPSIIESLPQAGYESKGVASFSSEFFVIDANGKVSIIPDSVGLNEEELEAWLADSDYTTKTYVDDRYFLASNFTKANIVAKLGISDWALAATKPSYKTSEVTEDTNLYFTNQRAIDALTDTLKAYVTLKGTQTIEGEKNFTGGLKVNGSPIVYDSEKGYWKLQGNLLITGGLTQYVDDGSVDLPNLYDGLPIDGSTIYWDNGVLKAKVAEGGITSITDAMIVEALGFTPYDATNPNGYITSDALNGYATQTWVNQQGFLTEHQDLSGYQPKITSSAKLAASLVSGLATVATSGSYNDLSNKPTIPSNTNQLTNGAGFITSSALSSYLPLSGGTLTGTLSITSINDSSGAHGLLSYHPTSWTGVTSSQWGVGATDSQGVIRSSNANLLHYKGGTMYTIWDSGNDGSGSGLDADLLDGVQLSGLFTNLSSSVDTNLSITVGGVTKSISNLAAYRTSIFRRIATATADNTYDLNDHVEGMAYSYSSSSALINRPSGMSYGQVLALNSSSGKSLCGQLAWDITHASTTDVSRRLWWRAADSTNGFTYSNWHQIAFTDSNVASATKLQTARTIWGQSFDGTGDVNGVITDTGSSRDIGLICQGSSYKLGFIIGSGNTNRGIYDYTNNSWLLYRNASTNVLIPQGNVGIGNASPTHTLDVTGTTRITGAVTLGSTLTGNAWRLGDSSTNPYLRLTRSSVNWYVQLITSGLALGTTSSKSCIIDADGNFLSVGGITQYSDIRKKTKLKDVELTLSQVANAPLIEHYYNSDDKKTTHVGSIAQYWAGLNDWFCKLDSDGFYTMEIQNAALASAISVARELERYESKTDKKIRMLKKRINELEDEIEKLKSA